MLEYRYSNPSKPRKRRIHKNDLSLTV